MTISIWGLAEHEYTSLVSREGVIRIDRIGPIYISGLTVSSAKKKIGRALSKIYSGINSSYESYQKVFFEVNLAKSRSIIVNLVVAAFSGAFLPLMSSVLNALSAAGGPNENGSFRAVKVLRNGKLFKTLDLYDYFVKGFSPSITLRDQDVILVPNYTYRVFVRGEFKTVGIFEFLENEKISDLLSFTGGFNSFAYKDELFIKSISGINRRIQTVSSLNYSSSSISDGDLIEAKPISDKYNNRVTIEGAVFVPGDYPIESAATAFDLISLSQGPKEDALLSRAVIYRQIDGVEKKVISFSLSEILSKKSNIKLLPNDRVYVFSKTTLKEPVFVSIKGEVNKEGQYAYYKGMTVADLILMADGVTSKGNLETIDVFRLSYDNGEASFVSLKSTLGDAFNPLSIEGNLVLEKEDLVVIRPIEGLVKQESVLITGLIRKPGIYSLLSSKYSLYDLLNDAGGVLKDAALNGIKVKRINAAKAIIEEVANGKDSLGFAVKEQKEFLEFGVNIKALYKTQGKDFRYNVVLKNGDEISVPKVDNTIEVIGEVGQPTVLTYEKKCVLKMQLKSWRLTILQKNSSFCGLSKRKCFFSKTFLIFNKSLQTRCRMQKLLFLQEFLIQIKLALLN